MELLDLTSPLAYLIAYLLATPSTYHLRFFDASFFLSFFLSPLAYLIAYLLATPSTYHLRFFDASFFFVARRAAAAPPPFDTIRYNSTLSSIVNLIKDLLVFEV